MNKTTISFKSLIIISVIAIGLVSCRTNPIIDDTPETPPADTVLLNCSFEDGTEGWTITGNESCIMFTEDAYSGGLALCLRSENTEASEVRLQQNLRHYPNGTYDICFYSKCSGKQELCVVSANERSIYAETSTDEWKATWLRGIDVSDSTLNFSIIMRTLSPSFWQIDSIRVLQSEGYKGLIIGGDMSSLTLVEQNGGKYYDKEGTEGDGMLLSSVNGMNLARLRLYNDPGNSNYYPSEKMYKDIQNESDVLSLAHRAKEAGMQLLLTFHYSDYWTNGIDQYPPHEWKEMSAEEVAQAVYDYTYAFMEKMKAQGTVPEYVSVGNETQAGMLYPLAGPLNSNDKDFNTKLSNLASFYNAAYKAVKASSADTRVIIHMSGAGDTDLYLWYCSLLEQYKVNYDIIGSSYYPYWTGRDAKTVVGWSEQIAQRFKKDIIFMEVGYAWNPLAYDGYKGQLENNYPYEDMSPYGQKDFLVELSNLIIRQNSPNILGFIYWDPVFIPAGNAGWIPGGRNVVSNTTLFDFSGHMLPVWDALRNIK